MHEDGLAIYYRNLKNKSTLFSQFCFSACVIPTLYESSTLTVVVKVHLIQNLKTILSSIFIFQEPMKISFELHHRLIPIPFVEGKGSRPRIICQECLCCALASQLFLLKWWKLNIILISPQSNELFHPSEQRNRNQRYRKKRLKSYFWKSR